MKRLIGRILIGFLFASPIFGQFKQLANSFYFCNNGIRTLPNAPKSLTDQSAIIKMIRVDGLFGHVG